MNNKQSWQIVYSIFISRDDTAIVDQIARYIVYYRERFNLCLRGMWIKNSDKVDQVYQDRGIETK